MTQPAQETYRFDLGRSQYLRIRTMGGLFLGALVVGAVATTAAGVLLWHTYTHEFTPYLKWQDALLALSWFLTFLCVGGAALAVRFLHALNAGYTQGMVTLDDKRQITVRDLSALNLLSIFWIMNSAFWCFVTVLVGLLPVILIGWTLHIPDPLLCIFLTGIASLLSLAGFVISIIATSFIFVGTVGGISFCRKLGSSHSYQLSGEATTIRIDNFVLIITYPGAPESMVDLHLLGTDERHQLLSLLQTRWIAAERRWNPTLGEEIAEALAVKEIA